MTIGTPKQGPQELPEELKTIRLISDAEQTAVELIHLMACCTDDKKAHKDILPGNIPACGETEDGTWESELGHRIDVRMRRRRKRRQSTADIRIMVTPAPDTRISIMGGLEPELMEIWKKKNRVRSDKQAKKLLRQIEELGQRGNKDFALDMAFAGAGELGDIPKLKQMKLSIRMKDPLHKDRVSFAFDPLIDIPDDLQSQMSVSPRKAYRRAIDALREIIATEREIAAGRLLAIACGTNRIVNDALKS